MTSSKIKVDSSRICGIIPREKGIKDERREMKESINEKGKIVHLQLL
jgi:hypothetical protein